MSQRFNYLITIAYKGTRFSGWQYTQNENGIANYLHSAFEIILKESVVINGASRTDQGVHAFSQIASFETSRKLDAYTFIKSVNGCLPIDIRVLSLKSVPLSFHATLNNSGKEYHYWLTYKRSQYPHTKDTMWHIPGELNVGSMINASNALLGTHDFIAFSNMKKDDLYQTTIRTIDTIDIIEQDEKTLQIVIRGKNFLYKMVRNIVGTLVHVGKGVIKKDKIPDLIKKKDRKLIGQTAPAHGLILFRVFTELID